MCSSCQHRKMSMQPNRVEAGMPASDLHAMETCRGSGGTSAKEKAELARILRRLGRDCSWAGDAASTGNKCQMDTCMQLAASWGIHTITW